MDGVSESNLGGANEGFAARRRACQRCFSFVRAPGLGGHGAESNPRLSA
jgi:hypothetical protein